MGDTPLGQIVNIRSENNPDTLKNFTPEQKKIRKDWAKRQAKNIDMEEYKKSMEQFKNFFKAMAKS